MPGLPPKVSAGQPLVSDGMGGWKLHQPIYVKARTSSAQVLTGSVTDVIFGTVDYAAGGGYNPVTGAFVAPVAGLYSVKASIGQANNNTLQLYKNGLFIDYGMSQPSAAKIASISTDIYLQPGDSITIRSDSSGTLNGSAPSNYLSIFKVPFT